MCQFCIHYFNNIRVRTQKSHITTLSRLQEVAIKKQISNFAKNTTVSDMQFLRPNLFVIKSNEFKIDTSLSFYYGFFE